MEYVKRFYPAIQLDEVLLKNKDEEENRRVLEAYFRVHERNLLAVVFNSRVYRVAAYLQEIGRKPDGLIGYDLLKKNVDYLKSGEVTCLIGQRPGLQGYDALIALRDHVLLKRTVDPVKYMPIDLLIRETIDYYFEFD